MKKFKLCLIITTIFISTSFTLTSCTNKEKSSTSNTTQAEDITENTENENSSKKDPSIANNNIEKPTNPDTNNTDTNNTNTDDKLNTKIPYPTFNDINNKDTVNSLILDYIKKLDKLYNSDTDSSLDINYKIMFKNNKYISLYFSGNIISTTAAYPSKFNSTLNINIEKAKTMRLDQIIKINDKFINTFNTLVEAKFKSLNIEVPHNFKIENLKQLLQSSDTDSEYISDVQSYFSKDNIIVILSVPHAIGDYIEISVPISSVDTLIF